MTNDDLKRLYPTNSQPSNKEDFVRYSKDGAIETKYNATKNNEVVNYQTLIKHAGGAGADINYRGPWISGMTIAQYDVVYINNIRTRTYYMATNNVESSTSAPNVDTDNFIVFLEVERDARLVTFPEASDVYLDEMFQYIGETDANFTNGYFYKCVRAISYYTIVGEDESIYYCAELPELGEEVQLYTDTTLETEATNTTLRYITTGYVIVVTDGEDEELINSTQIAIYSYSWQQWDVQSTDDEVIASGVDYSTTAPEADNADGLKFVVLSSEPITKYDGYIYFITE